MISKKTALTPFNVWPPSRYESCEDGDCYVEFWKSISSSIAAQFGKIAGQHRRVCRRLYREEVRSTLRLYNYLARSRPPHFMTSPVGIPTRRWRWAIPTGDHQFPAAIPSCDFRQRSPLRIPNPQQGSPLTRRDPQWGSHDVTAYGVIAKMAVFLFYVTRS